MNQIVCHQCKDKIDVWNKEGQRCGFHLVLEPEQKLKARYLRTPSLGALFFTQGWALGARLYFWFILSLIPAVGIAALILCVIFGRRWSWKFGSWSSWKEFQSRMRILDVVAIFWICFLMGLYLYFRF